MKNDEVSTEMILKRVKVNFCPKHMTKIRIWSKTFTFLKDKFIINEILITMILFFTVS